MASARTFFNIRHNLDSSKCLKSLQLKLLITYIPKTSVFTLFFFFSSRRRHTRFDCDWSSDVCSSDLFIQLNQRRFNLRWIERGSGFLFDPTRAFHHAKDAAKPDEILLSILTAN